MSDDIIEIKPGIGPFKLNVVALIRRLKGKGKNGQVDIVAERFLQIFQEHGVAIPQIPRLISQVTLEKLQNTESLLPALSNEVLERVVSLFGVRLSWLEGVDNLIYEPKTCYKQPHLFLETCAALNLPTNGFAVHALTTTKKLDGRNSKMQPLALVLVEKVQDFGNDEISRYHVYSDAWDWGHPSCRIQIKAMTRLMFQTSHRPIPLHQVKPEVLQAIIEGKCVPHAVMQRCLLTNPSLEDFALSSDESVQAKETVELPEVLDYIYRHKLDKVSQIGYWGRIE